MQAANSMLLIAYINANNANLNILHVLGYITLFVKKTGSETRELTKSMDWLHKLLKIQSEHNSLPVWDNVISLSCNLSHHEYVLKDFSGTTKSDFWLNQSKEG